MPLREQLTLMGSTDVVLSLAGADMMNCVFMPTRSALVIPDRYINGNWEASQDVRLWFKFLPGREVLTWRPKEWTPRDEQDGAIVLSPQRATRYVTRAISLLCRHGEVWCPPQELVEAAAHVWVPNARTTPWPGTASCRAGYGCEWL